MYRKVCYSIGRTGFNLFSITIAISIFFIYTDTIYVISQHKYMVDGMHILHHMIKIHTDTDTPLIQKQYKYLHM